MNVAVISVPYDSGHRAARMGRGPEHWLRSGLAAALEARGHRVEVHAVESAAALGAEIGTAFELHRGVAERVRYSVARGGFPLVLSGNCSSAVGTLAALGPEVGVAWFDAHGDFNTPETTTSGFLDGMALAVATGRCWRAIAATVPGFTPALETRVALIGARDLDPAERLELERSAIARVEAGAIRREGVARAFAPALERLRASGVRRLYLHLDLDVLDPEEAPANHYLSPGGLSVRELSEAVALLALEFEICACAVAAFDPEYDPAGRTVAAGLRVIEIAVDGGKKDSPPRHQDRQEKTGKDAS